MDYAPSGPGFQTLLMIPMDMPYPRVSCLGYVDK